MHNSVALVLLKRNVIEASSRHLGCQRYENHPKTEPFIQIPFAFLKIAGDLKALYATFCQVA